MIPKIIHYCWLSNDPYPEDVNKWMLTWKDKLPDYEFMLWNFSRFNKEKSEWVKEAFQNKKYAFAADYIRCYALYMYGGIYMDMDVEVLRSFNDILDRQYILGVENPAGIEAAVMGCEKGFELFGKALKYYENRHFVMDDGSFDQTTLPLILMRIIKENYKIAINSASTENVSDGERSKNKTLSLYSWDFFTGRNYPWREIRTNEHTYTIHHCADSWNSKNTWERVKRKIQRLIGVKATHFIIKIKRHRELRSLRDKGFGYNVNTGMCED